MQMGGKTDVKRVFRFIYYHTRLTTPYWYCLRRSVSVLLGATHILAGTGDWVTANRFNAHEQMAAGVWCGER